MKIALPDCEIPDRILSISQLDNDLHKAGVLSPEVILAIYRLTRGFDTLHSVETGCGKSTLLFSRISASHLCFTLGQHGGFDDESHSAVTHSPLFDGSAVEFVLGPTQRTLPAFTFQRRFQLVFIDGPHGYPFPELEYYFLYPQLEEGGLLILDDIHIPTLAHLCAFLAEDEMFEHLGNVGTTAFFRRTDAPLFDPFGDGWWLQRYNARRFDALAARFVPLRGRVYQRLARSFGPAVAERLRAVYKKLGG